MDGQTALQILLLVSPCFDKATRSIKKENKSIDCDHIAFLLMNKHITNAAELFTKRPHIVPPVT